MTDQDNQYNALQLKLTMIPNAVYEAARRVMRSAMLENYGTRRELIAAPRLGYIWLRSTTVRGVSQAVSRRMLDRCASHYGSFQEQPRISGVRIWQPAPWLYEHLSAEALAHWQKVGYVVGQRVPEIKTEAAP